MLLQGYLAIKCAKCAAAFDPDKPPHLSKVSETL